MKIKHRIRRSCQLRLSLRNHINLNDLSGPSLYINDEIFLQIGLTTFKGIVQTQWHYLMSISVMSYCPFYYYFSAFNAILSKVPIFLLVEKDKSEVPPVLMGGTYSSGFPLSFYAFTLVLGFPVISLPRWLTWCFFKIDVFIYRYNEKLIQEY